MTTAQHNPLVATSAAQMRDSRWALPPAGAWGVKKNAKAHLFPADQHFSLCGQRTLHPEAVFVSRPESAHRRCGFCLRVMEPKFGPRGQNEKGSRPSTERRWMQRAQRHIHEPLLTVVQFGEVVDVRANFDFQVTRLKVLGNTLHVFVDEGVVPAEYLDWITRQARDLEQVEWVEVVKYVDPVDRLVASLVTSVA